MRGLEYYELGDGDHTELIVNVTDIRDTFEVTKQLSAEWTWDSFQVQVTPAEEEGEEPTEWMTLIGVQRKVVQIQSAA